MGLSRHDDVLQVLYQGRDEEGCVDWIPPSKGGADEGVFRIVEDVFMIVGLGERTIVIRDGEQHTVGGNPPLSWVGVEFWLLLPLLLVLCKVSSLSLLLLLFLLLLLADTCAFELEVSQCLLNVIGASVLQLNTDTSVCVALNAVRGGVSTLSGGALGCVGPQLRDSCKEGVEP